MSKLTRRSKRSLLASREGASPSASKRARIKRSISFRGQDVFFTFGGGRSRTGTNDQCFSHSAPCSIQCLIKSISLGLRLRLDFGGGIKSSGSVVVIRRNTSLLLR